MVLLEKLKGLAVAAVVGQGDETLDADMGRAGGPTGRRSLLGDGKGTRDGLGVAAVDRLAVVQAHVVFAGTLDGADRDAVPAGGTFVRIDKARLLLDLGHKMAGLPLDGC